MKRKNEIRSFSTEQFRAQELEGEKTIEGYFAVFDEEYNVCRGGWEKIDRAAFSDDDLHGDVRCLIDHDSRLVLGRTSAGTLELHTDEHGLYGKVKINPEDSEAMNLYARVKRGDVSQCSFGFNILNESTEHGEDGSVHWLIKSVKLYEVSCCTFPAYETTEITARSKEIDAAKMQEWKQRAKARLIKC